jgi:hypothetical protein
MAGMNLRSHSLDKLRQIVTTAAHSWPRGARRDGGRHTAVTGKSSPSAAPSRRILDCTEAEASKRRRDPPDVGDR